MEEKKILSTHSLMLENRQNGRITGVKDIKSFDEKEEVDLEGKVDSLTYLSKNTDNRDESLFRRMFR